MDAVMWVLSGMLAVVFLGAGAAKLVLPHARLVENPNMGWATDFSPLQVRAIGLAEVAGALGLVLPGALGIAEWLVPLAAAGLTLDMLGAFSTHVRRGDPKSARTITLVLGVLALVVAIGRYWVEPL